MGFAGVSFYIPLFLCLWGNKGGYDCGLHCIGYED
jgi:hypothetical protein